MAFQKAALDTTSPRNLRSPSLSSDVFSTSGRSIAGAIIAANPKPQYIAQSAAAQLVSAELDRPVVVTEAALEYTNGFLDQTLYNLLLTSKSTALGALRLAVPKLCKPRLGQAALKAAEEELREYFEDDEAADLETSGGSIAPIPDFETELAWKLARLRCMVYARLGNMEEEDEDEYLEQEGLEEHTQNPQISTATTPALFLAAILEFLGEQALCTAAQHAEKRHQTTSDSASNGHVGRIRSGETSIVLDGPDMLQLGREGPLSRLWRSWRRDVRASEGISSRPVTPGFMMSPNFTSASQSPKGRVASLEGIGSEEESSKRALATSEVASTPSQIPLPMGTRDIDEIEVPGLAHDFEDGNNLETSNTLPNRRTRPLSMLDTPGSTGITPSPAALKANDLAGSRPTQPKMSRTRSSSVPTPTQSAVALQQHGSLQGTSVGDTSQNEHNETVEAESHSTAKTAIVGGAVAAIAGAVGMQTSKAIRNSKIQTGTSAGETDSKKTKTIAEEFLGPSSGVPPPTDADTGASITNFSDFESMHVPQVAAEPLPPQELDGREVSDPEDLALSSADEENVTRTQNPALRDSGLGVIAPGRDNAPVTKDAATTQTGQAEPTSPKKMNREAAVYDDSLIPMRQNEEAAAQSGKNRPSSIHQATTKAREVDASDVTTKTPTSPSAPGMHAANFSEPKRNSDTSGFVPVRGSSLDQHRSSQGPDDQRMSYNSQHSKSSSSSSRLLGFTRDPTGPALSNNPYRASMNEPANQSRPSHSHNTSVARDQRPGTASSSTNAKREHRRLRPDQEDSLYKESAESKKKNLENLIKSDETLHYTLTPESARAEEFPRAPTKSKTQTQELADFFRNTAPPGDDPPRPYTARSSRQSLGGLRSNPPEPAQNVVAATSEHRGRASSGAIARPASAQSKTRISVGEPRDARTERNTTRDLADYARSTGPASDTQLPQSIGSRPASRQSNRRVPVLRADGVPMKPPGAPSMDTVRSASERPANRLKFQARDPRPSRAAESADLIDFIREGPPRVPGDHRIDRHVAPFRTTMDSDDLNALAPPQDPYGRNSVGSARESSMTARSVQESTNSRTALLDSTNRNGARAVNGAGSAGNGVARQIIPEQDGAPQRTRRRVRDPYAIDDSDDELDEVAPVRAAAQRKNEEESLIDFLRNTSPPPGTGTQPVLAPTPRPVGSPPRPNVIVQRPRARSPHLTQVGSKLDKYRPTKSTHAAHVERNRQKSRGDGRDGLNANGDMANSVRHAGPAEGRVPPYSASPVREQAGFLKFFSRKGSVRQ